MHAHRVDFWSTTALFQVLKIVMTHLSEIFWRLFTNEWWLLTIRGVVSDCQASHKSVWWVHLGQTVREPPIGMLVTNMNRTHDHHHTNVDTNERTSKLKEMKILAKYKPKMILTKEAVSQSSVIFLCLFCVSKNGNCLRKCRRHQTMTAQSAERTASPPKTSRSNVVFRNLARWPPLFFPTQNGWKKRRLLWHCRFNMYRAPSLLQKLNSHFLSDLTDEEHSYPKVFSSLITASCSRWSKTEVEEEERALCIVFRVQNVTPFWSILFLPRLSKLIFIKEIELAQKWKSARSNKSNPTYRNCEVLHLNEVWYAIDDYSYPCTTPLFPLWLCIPGDVRSCGVDLGNGEVRWCTKICSNKWQTTKDEGLRKQ